MLINTGVSKGVGSEEEEEEEDEEVCVVGNVEYYSDFCLDWRGVPVREVGGGEGGGSEDERKVEWKPNEDTSVLYPTTSSPYSPPLPIIYSAKIFNVLPLH